jgi:hypothetical protein
MVGGVLGDTNVWVNVVGRRQIKSLIVKEGERERERARFAKCPGDKYSAGIWYQNITTPSLT